VTEFERCKVELVEWTAFCQGYDAADLRFNRHVGSRCYSDELFDLRLCETVKDLVIHVLTYVPTYACLNTMRERWQRFRYDAFWAQYQRTEASDHPVPCDKPSVIERLRWLMLNGEQE
jgi:hypothetical protein